MTVSQKKKKTEKKEKTSPIYNNNWIVGFDLVFLSF